MGYVVRILCISNLFPLPVDRGHATRLASFLPALAREHDVHLLTLRRPDTTPELEAAVAERYGLRVEIFAPRAAPHPGVRAKLGRWSRSLLAGTPPWVLEELHPALLARARALAPQSRVVCLMDDYAFAYAPGLSGLAPILADKNTVLGGEGFARRKTGVTVSEDVNHRFGIALTRRFERDTSRSVDVLVTTNELEADGFERLYARRPDAVVPSGVEMPPAATLAPGARVAGWLGSMGWPPNTDGLCEFVEAAWAPLGDAGWQLWAVGGGVVPERVRALEGHRGVKVLGYVERLEEVFDELSAAVVPIWAGAGVRLKTLSLMGAGVPTVATPAALEGIPAVDGEHCLVADTPDGMAAALVRIDADPELAHRLSGAGRRLVEDGFSAERVGERFLRAVELAAARPAGRAAGA